MRKILTLIMAFMAFGTSVVAEAIDYDIVTDNSFVGFSYQFGENDVRGKFLNYNTDISIDFENVDNTRIDVVLNTATASAGFVFATQAMRSDKVLDTNTHPNIKFVSKSVKPSGLGAIVDGLITVRGITKPLILQAQLLRGKDTLATERENFRILLTGALNRHDFGASGYPNSVGDMLTINIDAQIKRK